MIVRDKSNSFKLLFAWRGTVLPKVLPTILGIMVLSFIAGFVAQFQWYYIATVPAVGFTMFGVIISIFLGFRNNACYDRWWEGRKLWGALVANTRHLSRDSHFLAPNERESLLYQMLLFVAILRDRLRGQNIQRSQFGYTKIDDHYLDWLDQQINAPQRVLEAMQQQLIKLVQQGQMSDVIYMTIQKHVIEMGGASKRAAIVFIARHCHFLTQHYCIGRYIVFVGLCRLACKPSWVFGHRYWLGLFLIYCLG